MAQIHPRTCINCNFVPCHRFIPGGIIYTDRDGGYECFKPIPQWHLDTHSTILSRKHSYHKRVGKLIYVKTKYERS